MRSLSCSPRRASLGPKLRIHRRDRPRRIRDRRSSSRIRRHRSRIRRRSPGGPPIYSAPIYAPEEIRDFDDTRPVPYGYTRVYRARKGLIIGGAVTLGSVYLATTLVATGVSAVNEVDGTHTDITAVYVPVVGPFLEISQTDNFAARFFLTLSAAGQTAGAIMLIYGLTNPRTVLVRNDQLSIGLAPVIGNGASGLSVVGRF